MNISKPTIILALASSLLLTACGQTATPQSTNSEKSPVKVTATEVDNNNNSDSKTTLSVTPFTPPTNTTNTMDTEKNAKAQLMPPQKGDEIATLETSEGTLKIRLFKNITPNTVENFVQLSKQGKYNGVTFHRVIKDFMIQTGDFENRNGTGGYSFKGPGTTVQDEIKPELRHLQYAVSMAKKGGASDFGSQFFIVSAAGGTSFLDNQYTVFGQVYEGMNIVDKIEKTKTAAQDKPVQDITIKKVAIEEVK